MGISISSLLISEQKQRSEWEASSFPNRNRRVDGRGQKGGGGGNGKRGRKGNGHLEAKLINFKLIN